MTSIGADGGAGDDTLIGGIGNDVLTGSSGDDHFVFDTTLNAASNVDMIADFTSGDRLELDNAIFAKLKTFGTLSADAFHTGTSATDASHHIIYDDTTGKLYYDADGSGSAAQIHFATLSGTPSLSNTDFVVI